MKDIDKIIDKYFEGETSLTEEKILEKYFQQASIEEKHQIYKPMFNFFSNERKETKPEEKKKIKPLYAWIGVVASIILLISISIIDQMPLKNTTEKSLVYINGKKATDINAINREALISIKNISDVDEDIMNSQIGILELFTE